MSSSTAAWLLSTVAGATITTAGVVFFLTVVSLQLASSQFSPRVMRSFIRNRLIQVVIWAVTATFVYAVLTLRSVDASATGPAPRVTISVAVLLTVVTVLLIVTHLNHLARGLQVGEVVRRISEGEEVLAATSRATRTDVTAAAHAPPSGEPVLTIPAPRDGWVTRAPADRMLATIPPDATVRLETRAGAHIHAGSRWPRSGPRLGIRGRCCAGCRGRC